MPVPTARYDPFACAGQCFGVCLEMIDRLYIASQYDIDFMLSGGLGVGRIVALVLNEEAPIYIKAKPHELNRFRSLAIANCSTFNVGGKITHIGIPYDTVISSGAPT